MQRVEKLISQFGIDATGYAQTEVPQVEWAPPDHPYLQGNDGAYVDGHIYIDNEAIAECVDLTLLHELVHDATAKGHLFATVANDQVHDMFEALADAITETAAQDPYLPGCLPRRHFAMDRDELVALATRHDPRVAAATESSAMLAALDAPLPARAATDTATAPPELPAEGLAMLRCHGLLGDPCIALPPPL